jgi:hypothetical protein
MGTFVHPRSEDPAFLERLAGVPAGTAAEHAAWKAAEPADYDQGSEASMAAYSRWLDSVSLAVDCYNAFQDQGFGRLQAVEAVRARGLDHVADETTDPTVISAVLVGVLRPPAPGITVAEIAAAGGVYWA